MKFAPHQKLRAVVGATIIFLAVTAAFAATIDQYGNRHLSDGDMAGYAYENAKFWNSGPSTPQIDMSAFDAYTRARNAESSGPAYRPPGGDGFVGLEEYRAQRAASAAAAEARHEEVLRDNAATLEKIRLKAEAQQRREIREEKMRAGDETTCEERAVELMSGIANLPHDSKEFRDGAGEAAAALGYIKAEHASPIVKIQERALSIFAGWGAPGLYTYTGHLQAFRTNFSQSVEFNLALGALLADASQCKSNLPRAERLHGYLAAALHSLAVGTNVTDYRYLRIEPGIAAVVRDAQRATPRLRLTPEASELIERSLHSIRYSLLYDIWPSMAGSPSVIFASESPALIDPRVINSMAWADIPIRRSEVIECLRTPDGERLAWINDPASLKMFRDFIEQEITAWAADSAHVSDYTDIITQQRRELKYACIPESIGTLAQVSAWQRHDIAFQNRLPWIAPKAAAAFATNHLLTNLFSSFIEPEMLTNDTELTLTPDPVWKKKLEIIKRESIYATAPFNSAQAEKLLSWETHARTYTNNPSTAAAQVLLDATEGSPIAYQFIDTALTALTERELPAASLPIIAQLLHAPVEQLPTPSVRCLTAWVITLAKGSYAFTPDEQSLITRLITVTTNDFLSDQAMTARMQTIAVGFGDLARAERDGEAFVERCVAWQLGTHVKGDVMPHDDRVRDLLLSYRMIRINAGQLNDAETLSDTIYKMSHLIRTGSGSASLLCDPDNNIPALLERVRQLDVGYGDAAETNATPVQSLTVARKFDAELVDSLISSARTERGSYSQNPSCLDAMIDEVIRPGVPPIGFEYLWAVLSPPPPSDDFPPISKKDWRARTRTAARQRAESLASALLWYRLAPAKESADLLLSIQSLAAYPAEDNYETAWEIVGRDLHLGGLATRALLLLKNDPQFKGTFSSPEQWTNWLAAVGKLPAILPPETVLNQMFTLATSKSATDEQSAIARQGLAAAAEKTFHARLPARAVPPIRAAALKIIADHTTELAADTHHWPSPLKKYEAKFLAARVEWEQARIQSPDAKPIQLAAPIAKKLGAAGVALAFALRGDFDLKPGHWNVSALECPGLLESDPTFATGLIRALAFDVPDGSELLTRFAKMDAPSNDEHWQALLAGRAWEK